METYGKILLIAMPIFLGLVLLEKLYGVIRGRDTVRNMDMVSSLSSGVTNATKDVLGLTIAIISYSWMVKNLAIVHVPGGILTYIIAFVVLDFAGYWVHRVAHEYNFFWNNHIVHHSSEEFNLACALRQSISVFFRIFTFLLLPAALLGVPEQVIIIVAPLHLFAQFWYHTQHIGRLGFLENIIVTPSHHRVHHAINPIYLDKNYSQIFIFWDKLFGTFQEECDDVKPVYGITRPVQTWNPIKINFQHIILLIKDAWRTQNWKDKFRIWMMPTGWRPADMNEKYPIKNIDDVYHFEKYNPRASVALHFWAWIQLLIILGFVSFFFGNIAAIGTPQIFYYGGFIYLSVYALTDLMDRSPSAIVWELGKNALGYYMLQQSGDWFGAGNYGAYVVPVMQLYFLISTIITLYFVFRHYQEDQSGVPETAH